MDSQTNNYSNNSNQAQSPRRQSSRLNPSLLQLGYTTLNSQHQSTTPERGAATPTTTTTQSTPPPRKKMKLQGMVPEQSQEIKLNEGILQDTNAHISSNELVRVILQTLTDLGFNASAELLQQESSVQLESDNVHKFRDAVMQGSWDTAEACLTALQLSDNPRALFLIRSQKFMELLQVKDTKHALYVLRNELTTLEGVESSELHTLSSYMMCSSFKQLSLQAGGWSGAHGDSRSVLFESLQNLIPSSLMLPPRRLLTLLEQALMHQRTTCIYHNAESNSYLLSVDHCCIREDFPRITTHTLDEHNDEVWYLAFAHHGLHLASASKDGTAIIWSVKDKTPIHTMVGHEDAISFLAWSPDDKLLLTCSNDNKVRLWDTSSGHCLKVFSKHIDAVTSCAWLPDSQRFVSSSLDKTIFLWNIDGSLLYRWIGARVTDIAVSRDGHKMVAVCSEKKIRIYDLENKNEESVQEDNNITSLSLSNDSQFALVSVAQQEIHLWDLVEKKLVHKYTGQKQGRFVIRSCFGGANQAFIVSGSEDCNVYIWHRAQGRLLEVLSGHTGTVNSVSWNPADPLMFASASDDCTIRLWGKSK